jgi:hypothetical protein
MISTLLFEKFIAQAIYNVEMMAAIFFLNKCRIEIAWIENVVHDLQGRRFAFDPPFCKIYNSVPFCVNLCATHMYYVVHKQGNLI